MSHTYKYPRPAVTVDSVVYHLQQDSLQVLLIKRKQDPFAGSWALPGGFMDINEPPEVAVRRELKEETGLQADDFLQIGAFGAVDRDPRHRTLSVAYLSLLKGSSPQVKGADDAEEADWFPINELPAALAFDHDHILEQARAKLHLELQNPSGETAEKFRLSEEEVQQVLNKIA